MWGIDLMEGKDCPCHMGQQTYDDLGVTVGLLLQLLAQYFSRDSLLFLTVAFVC